MVKFGSMPTRLPAHLVRALLDIKELGLVEGKALRVGLYGPIRVLMRWS